MATHDRYDNDILKQLTRIANALEKIERALYSNGDCGSLAEKEKKEKDEKEELEKTCDNCNYKSLTYGEYPCCCCGLLDHCMWIPAEAEEGGSV